jgi:hypothetical protein
MYGVRIREKELIGLNVCGIATEDFLAFNLDRID